MTFDLSESQTEQAVAWVDKHTKEKHPKPRHDGAIGGRYTWSFTPTSIGMVAKVTCACGEKIDLSDYQDW